MDPAAFPIELRNYFLTHTEKTDNNQEITQLFTENEAVREAFIDWAKSHRSTVEFSPRLYNALNLAFDSPLAGVAKAVNSLYLWYKDDGSSKLINEVLQTHKQWTGNHFDKSMPDFPPNYATRALELFESGVIDEDQLVELFSLKSENRLVYKTPTFRICGNVLCSGSCRKAGPLLEKLDSSILLKLFSIEINGTYALNTKEGFWFNQALLKKLDSNLIQTLLSFQDDEEGKTPFHHDFAYTFYLFDLSDNDRDPLIETLEPKVLFPLLSIQDNRGETPLHNLELFQKAKTHAILHKLSDEDLNQLLTIEDNEGNTPLHNLNILKLVLEDPTLSNKIRPELVNVKVAGFPLEEWQKIHVSDNWLVKDKTLMPSEELSDDEYDQRALQLKNNVDSLWKAFEFGGGNIPEIYLQVKNKMRTPEKIKAKLDEFVSKIVGKTPWLGTPEEKDTKGLHLFYTQMLLNFEDLVSQLMGEPDPAKQAAPLIDLAKVAFEKRCAAAYQSEMDQAKIVLNLGKEDSTGTMEANFEKLAQAYLNASIEKVVMDQYEGDSHAFSQMLYSVGMAMSPDPLSTADVLNCQTEIKVEWTKNKLVSNLKQLLGRMDVEELRHWFELRTPEEHGREYNLQKDKAELAEMKIARESKGKLNEKRLKHSLIESAVDIFQSTKGAGFRISNPSRESIPEGVLEKLDRASTLEEVEQAETFFKEAARSKRIELIELKEKLSSISNPDAQKLKEISTELQELNKKQMQVNKIFIPLKRAAETRIKFGDLLKKSYPSLSRDELDIILAEKQRYDEKVKVLSEEMDINFNPSVDGLPSRALNYRRKQDYADPFFSNRKLNKRGVVEILLHIGVLEK